MKLIIIEHGDWDVGIPDSYFEIDCPFNKEDLAEEDIQDFKEEIAKIYMNFCEGKIRADFDFEIDEENKILEEFDDAVQEEIDNIKKLEEEERIERINTVLDYIKTKKP